MIPLLGVAHALIHRDLPARLAHLLSHRAHGCRSFLKVRFSTDERWPGLSRPANSPSQSLHQWDFAAAFRLRVAAAFFADAERCSALRLAEAAPPFAPPLWLDACDSFLPRPPPDFFPPPDSLFTVAQ